MQDVRERRERGTGANFASSPLEPDGTPDESSQMSRKSNPGLWAPWGLSIQKKETDRLSEVI